MKIGYFSNFKGANTVLLDCDSSEIIDLMGRLEKFTSSTDQSMLVQSSKSPSVETNVDLFLVASATPAESEQGMAFSWLCSSDELTKNLDKLSSLVGVVSGHHYIELLESNTQLIISTGEYGDLWWQEHG